MTGAPTLQLSTAAAPEAGCARWVTSVLVGVALVAWLASLTLFLTTPLASLPLYFVQRYFVLDATSLLFVWLVNTIFLGIAVYMLSRVRTSPVLEQDMPKIAALSIAFMVVMNLGLMSNNLLMMWACIEATTLCAAPMVAKGESNRAGRVAWRYMLYSTISLALTFLGFLCLTHSAHLRGIGVNFNLDQIPQFLVTPGDPWQRIGFSLMLFGLGSKLGLAPMYGWLPETYETAPPSISALLAAIQFNASIVAVFRILQVFRADHANFIAYELLLMGCLSLTVAAVQIMAARNYKRLLAYACVSSGGVIAIGLSVGRAAAYGVVLYVVSSALVKALLFLTAGRMQSVYKTKEVAALDGVIKILPFSGLLFTIGIFALLGFPPFGSFMAEMLILSGIVQAGHFLAFTLMCTMLTIIFVAMGRSIFPMVWGSSKRTGPPVREALLTALPKLFFVGILVSLGIYTPESVSNLLLLVAASFGGSL